MSKKKKMKLTFSLRSHGCQREKESEWCWVTIEAENPIVGSGGEFMWLKGPSVEKRRRGLFHSSVQWALVGGWDGERGRRSKSMGLDAGSWWLVAPALGRQSEADAQSQVGSETLLSVSEIILSCWVSTLSCLEPPVRCLRSYEPPVMLQIWLESLVFHHFGDSAAPNPLLLHFFQQATSNISALLLF